MATLLRIVAAVVCSIIAIGFLIFAVDESDRAARERVSLLNDQATEKKREGKSGPVKEAVNDANEFVLAPFDDVTDSRNAWVRQIVPTVLGLLFYGLGLLLLANWLPKPKHSQRDWRTA